MTSYFNNLQYRRMDGITYEHWQSISKEITLKMNIWNNQKLHKERSRISQNDKPESVEYCVTIFSHAALCLSDEWDLTELAELQNSCRVTSWRCNEPLVHPSPRRSHRVEYVWWTRPEPSTTIIYLPMCIPRRNLSISLWFTAWFILSRIVREKFVCLLGV